MSHELDIETARAELHRAVMAAFCNTLHASLLPPMTVMALTAAAVGAIYRDIADEHRRDTVCPCGWQPSTSADVEALQSALASTVEVRPLADLAIVQVVGRA
ncbi:MAG: hypothetical protein KGZ91_19450 [Afipia sp.]|nr:hypothetical protein [Afipia sp.]